MTLWIKSFQDGQVKLHFSIKHCLSKNSVSLCCKQQGLVCLGWDFPRQVKSGGPERVTPLCCYACQSNAMGKCQAQGTQLHLSIYVRLLLLSLLSHIKRATMSHFNSNWSSGRWRMLFFFSFLLTWQDNGQVSYLSSLSSELKLGEIVCRGSKRTTKCKKTEAPSWHDLSPTAPAVTILHIYPGINTHFPKWLFFVSLSSLVFLLVLSHQGEQLESTPKIGLTFRVSWVINSLEWL